MLPTENQIQEIKDKYPLIKNKLANVFHYMKEYEDNPFLKNGPWDDSSSLENYFSNVRDSRDYSIEYYKEIIHLFKGDISIKNELLVDLPKATRKELIRLELKNTNTKNTKKNSENMVTEEKYNDLLYKSGQTINHLKVFIDTLIESEIVPKNKLKVTQDYLREQLLTENAKDILKEYNDRIELVNEEIEKHQDNINVEEILEIIDKELSNI